MKKKKKDQAFLQGDSVAVSSDSTMQKFGMGRTYVRTIFSNVIYIGWVFMVVLSLLAFLAFIKKKEKQQD